MGRNYGDSFGSSSAGKGSNILIKIKPGREERKEMDRHRRLIDRRREREDRAVERSRSTPVYSERDE